MEVPEAAAGLSWVTAGSAPGTQDQTSIADPHLAFSKENVRVKPGYLVRGNISVRMILSLSYFPSRSLVGRLGRAGGRFSRGNVRVFVWRHAARARGAGRNLGWTSTILRFHSGVLLSEGRVRYLFTNCRICQLSYQRVQASAACGIEMTRQARDSSSVRHAV